MRRAITALFVAAAMACGGDSSTAPTNDKPAGAYELRQVNGGAIPAKIYHGPYFDAATPHFYEQLIVEVMKGTIELNENGRYRIELRYRFNGDGQVAISPLTDEGEYQMQPGQVHFQSDDAEQYSAMLEKGTIELELPNTLRDERPIVRYSFRK